MIRIAVLGLLLSSTTVSAEGILSFLNRGWGPGLHPVMVEPLQIPNEEKQTSSLSRSEIEIREKQEALWRLHRRHGIRER